MNWFLPIALGLSAAYLGRDKIGEFIVGTLDFRANPNASVSNTSLLTKISNGKKLSAVYSGPLSRFASVESISSEKEWVFTDNRGGVYTIYPYKNTWSYGGNKIAETRKDLFLEWLKRQ